MSFEDHGIYYVWGVNDQPHECERVEAPTPEQTAAQCWRSENNDGGEFAVTCWPWTEIRRYRVTFERTCKVSCIRIKENES